MYRALPVINRVLNKKWEEISQSRHESKLRLARSSIETRTPPIRFRHVKLNHKKGQMQEDRYTEIERENRILLEKMTNILQQNRKKRKESQKLSRLSLHRESLTSNLKKRHFDQLKITTENQNLLKRLQDKRATYSVMKWKNENMERRKILNNICEYPYQLNTCVNKSVSPMRRNKFKFRNSSRDMTFTQDNRIGGDNKKKSKLRTRRINKISLL